MNTTTQFLCIKTLTAPKTGLNAKGAITYAVLRDTASTDIYICLLGNEGGGYYSQEAVSLTAIEQCLAGLDPSGVIPSKVFKAAFSGKSVNNSGFLAAVLRSELLLQPNPDAAHQHLLSIDFDEWRTEMLNAPAEPFELPSRKKDKPVVKAITNAAEEVPTEHKKNKKTRKSAAEKRELPSLDQEGGADDCPA